MSYQVLARKWRPRRFDQMVGQEPILRMLSNALEQQRLHHAYLLTGTRGVGKTTLGRILAKCLNCETGITSKPCGECRNCQAIDNGQFLDLYEVDAASRTKVEDTRDMLENVCYPPSQGRFKIYLIDEVHMLSNHSFNALLKTLEEPPEHVKFILATTDPKRLPVTILSRCLQFHLKHISADDIGRQLQTICQTENLAFEIDALKRIAKAANGSMRDALSILDQAIAYGHGAVNTQDVNTMLGSLGQEDILPLINALCAQDGKQLLTAVAKLAESAADFQQVLEEIISLFHQIAMVQCVADLPPGDDNIATLAKAISAQDTQLYYQIALLCRRDLDLAPSPQQGFEMAMLRMLAMKPAVVSVQTQPVPLSPPAAPSRAAIAKPQPAKEAVSAQAISTADDWRAILPKLELTGMAYALAANCQLESVNDHQVILTLSSNHQPMLNAKLRERIEESLTRHFKKPLKLELRITTEEIATPIKHLQDEQKAQLAAAKQDVLQDPKIKQLIDMYDATVEVSLLS